MGPADLQSYIVQSIPNSSELVDLLKVAEDKGRRNNGILKLAVDGECCLDRLYGGFYPDWVCGGQWNKMEQFLKNFTAVVQSSNLELVIFFNGSLEPERITTEWKKRQEETYRFLQEVHKHVSLKKKPPPKIWWIPPAFLRSAVRLAFRSLNMKVLCTLDDHNKDIVKYIKKNHLHGIVADDPVYLAFDFIERYFSAQKLKLTYKGSLETVEIKISKVFETLDLPKDRFLIFAAIFGHDNLTEEDLKDFFSSFEEVSASQTQTKTSVIEKVAQFIRTLEAIDAPSVANLVVEKSTSKTDDEKQQLRTKVLKCLRYFGAVNNANKKNPNKSNASTMQSNSKTLKVQSPTTPTTVTTILTRSDPATSETNSFASPLPAASTLLENPEKSDTNSDSEDAAGTKDLPESLVSQLASLDLDGKNSSSDLSSQLASLDLDGGKTFGELPSDRDLLLESNSSIFDLENLDDHTLKVDTSFLNDSLPSSSSPPPTATTSSSTESTSTPTSSANSAAGTSAVKKGPSAVERLLYHVTRKIENVAVTRHESGLMSPYICQILKHREIKLPLIIYDMKSQSELPKAKDLFRPLRQKVYAVLFNLHHLHFVAKQKSETVPPVVVKETFYDPSTNEIQTDEVRAVELGWGVPTVEKLWLGDGEECKKKRIRAFFTCLKSEKEILLNSSIVPQHLLVLCCVLRYILSEKKVLRKSELDAFILQAFILEVTDANVAQDIEVANLTMRGIHLSHLFMEGVEMALLTNDACGAPVPFVLFSPWFFFNGKIFNYVLEQQALGKSIPEICGFKMEIAYNVEQLRMAILNGLKPQFVLATPVSLMNIGRNVTGPILLPPRNEVPRTSSQISCQGTFGGLSGLAFEVNGAGGGSGISRGRSGGGLVANPYACSNPFQGNYLGNGNFGAIPRQPQRGYPTMPVVDRVRRVPARGGQLQIAGTVVGSWGANPYYNTLPPAGAVRRNPLDGAVRRNPLPNREMNSLFDQRISGNKVPNSNRGGSHRGSRSQQRNKNKNQKKSTKKNGECSGENEASTAGEAATASGNNSNPETAGIDNQSTNVNTDTPATGIKVKEVSFQDEPNFPSASRFDFGAGDSSHFIATRNGDNEVFLNSLGALSQSSLTTDNAASSVHF